MRTAYRQQLAKLEERLVDMWDQVEEMVHLSSSALLTGDSAATETVLAQARNLEQLRGAAEAEARELLALEAPVARDLRQVVSGIYIVEDIARMGALSAHIATTPPLPEPLQEPFQRMADLCERMAHHTRQVLDTYDVDGAVTIGSEDDSVDEIHQEILDLLKSSTLPSPAIVDATLLNRYYERFADHAVTVARRIIFLATGQHKDLRGS